MEVRLQMGGADQWGNITTGTHLIGKKLGHEAKAFAITCPLITREDGSKFGKTADGESIWLDPNKTSPFQFYQYWINVSDADAEKYIKVFTLRGQEDIEQLISEHREAPHIRNLQKALAEDVTRTVHGQEALDSAIAQTNFFFARKLQPKDLKGLSEAAWQDIVGNASDVKKLSRDKISDGLGIIDLLVELGIAQSNGDARRAIQKDNAISVNAEKCSTIDHTVAESDAYFGSYLLVQRGKKNKFIVEID